MAKFFVNPFAISGTRTPIPEGAQPSGAVSYTTGFTLDYSLDQTSNPNAKNVPRDKTNELYYEITLALQQYQTSGSPNFITTSDNLGVPYPYTYNAIVNYNDGLNGIRLYRSLINNNTNLPSVQAAWQILPFFINGTATGTANALTLNTASVYQNFIFGDEAQLKIATTNTGPATLQIGNGPAVAIRKVLNGLEPLAGNEIKSGGIYDFVSDGTYWILKNPSVSTTVLYSRVTFQNNSGQQIPQVSSTKAHFNAVVTDSNSWWDQSNFRFIPNLPGKYEIKLTMPTFASFVIPTDPSEIIYWLHINGAPIQALTQFFIPDGMWSPSCISAIYEANGTTDYFEIFVQNTETAPIYIAYNTQNPGPILAYLSTKFEIRYIGQ